MLGPYEIEKWISEEIFHMIPLPISIIDNEYFIVYANIAFEKSFGSWQSKKCFDVYQPKSKECVECNFKKVFDDGNSHNFEEQSENGNRFLYHYAVPIKYQGVVHFILDLITDISEVVQMRKEYQTLFDQVPCNIMIIDKNFKIQRTNKQMENLFGDIRGTYCYQKLKGLKDKCFHCTAHKSFADGGLHTGYSRVKDKDGNVVHLQVTTMPIDTGDSKNDLVLEMAVDVTNIFELEGELKVARGFRSAMIASSMEAIIALDKNNDITIVNDTAKKLLNLDHNVYITREDLEEIFPIGYMNEVFFNTSDNIHLPDTQISTLDGQPIPVHLTGIKMMVDDKYMGMVFWIHDLRRIKELEEAKLDAERLAAVGQTVAGLAHGIKNLLTGLEGGMYMLNSGINKGNVERITSGMDMLTRNIDRVSTFVREFLAFSKGRKIEVKISDPKQIAGEVVELYTPKAHDLGIELILEKLGDIKPAPIDYEGMHECLTNLVGNAIDACQMSDGSSKCRVVVKTIEKDNMIIYEVTDNGCGMDYDVKKKVFTNFFTTKGLGGTGLGLLTTKKIIQEHGGTIEVESESGKGSTFRIKLPRKQLPKVMQEENPVES